MAFSTHAASLLKAPQSLGAKIVASGNLGTLEAPPGTALRLRPREAGGLAQSHTAAPTLLACWAEPPTRRWAGSLHIGLEKKTWQKLHCLFFFLLHCLACGIFPNQGWNPCPLQ